MCSWRLLQLLRMSSDLPPKGGRGLPPQTGLDIPPIRCARGTRLSGGRNLGYFTAECVSIYFSAVCGASAPHGQRGAAPPPSAPGIVVIIHAQRRHIAALCGHLKLVSARVENTVSAPLPTYSLTNRDLFDIS